MRIKWIEYIKKWAVKGYDKRCFHLYRNEINQYNIGMLNFFNILVTALLVIVFISGFFTGYVADMQPIYIGMLVFTLLEMAADRLFFFRKCRHMDVPVFLCMTKIYGFCIISGIFYSLEAPAISFFAFMIVLSILFIVRGWKLNLYNFLVVLLFSVFSYLEKKPSVAQADIYNCWIFYIVASVVSFWIIKLRVDSIRNEELLTEQRDTDILTTLPNRRRFNIYAKEAFEAGKDKPLNFLMMDIDHFKAYNDSKGHMAGDYCLESIGKALAEFGKEQGIFFARYGGEEFVAIDTLHCQEELEKIAQRIVDTIYRLGLPHESSVYKRITISVGYAAREAAGADTYIQLLECADKALYLAKSQGRNKIAGYQK